MYILCTDETNKEPSENVKFFIYGGIFIPTDKAGQLHQKIEVARSEAGYKACDLLKFDTNKRPEGVSQETATILKQKILASCIECGCRFSVLIIHHKIASKLTGSEDKFLWAHSHIVGHFNYFLRECQSYGIVITDRLPVQSPDKHLVETFSNGLNIDGKKRVKLDRVTGLATGTIGASHFYSAIDVVLGSFRWCVNNIDGQNPKTATMLKSIAQMLWSSDLNGTRYVRERGLIFRPQKVKVDAYRKAYDDLTEKIEKLINS